MTARNTALAMLAGAAALTLALTTGAQAQTYGTVSLAPGQLPVTLNGQSGGQVGVPGGQIDASTYGTTASGPCRGWIGASPDHLMTVTTAVSALSVAVTATVLGDTALVVSGPGGVRCNDDTNGLNPAVSGAFEAGTYSVWVASYSQTVAVPYSITFAAGGAATPPVATPPATPPVATATPELVGMMAASVTPNDTAGALVIAPGFMPDPQYRNGNTTGGVDLNTNAALAAMGCRGHVNPNPDHLLQLTGAFSSLSLHARSTTDTTMLVQDSAGRVLCADDVDGVNPRISGAFPAGALRVWVGTYQSGVSAPYAVEISESP